MQERLTSSVCLAIKAAITHTQAPTIPLVLLALILGLPAVLIVLTAHRWSYVAWMVVYLLSLPIWNFVLPGYAYWKFDDFSWGDTRKTAGETSSKGGHEHEGEFDSSKITMRRWHDFEAERRLKAASTAGVWAPSTTAVSGNNSTTAAPAPAAARRHSAHHSHHGRSHRRQGSERSYEQ